MIDKACGNIILRADVTARDVTVGIENANVVGHVAETDGLSDPVEADEIRTFASSLVGAVGENLLVRARLCRKTHDEGRARFAVSDLCQNVGVADESNRRRVLRVRILFHFRGRSGLGTEVSDRSGHHESIGAVNLLNGRLAHL